MMGLSTFGGAPLGASATPTPDDAHRARRAAWVDFGILTIKVTDPGLDDWTRQVLMNTGAALYGRLPKGVSQPSRSSPGAPD